MYKYAYDNRLLAHCIDMSWYFTDDDEPEVQPDQTPAAEKSEKVTLEVELKPDGSVVLDSEDIAKLSSRK